MAADIREWLNALALEEHIEAFIENGVDMSLLPELTNDDLKDLGVSRLADRKRIIKAIAEPLTNSEMPAATQREADRRQLTVLFCDMVGSTELSQKLDPEDMREAIRNYQDAVAGAINRYQGHVAKFLGDGVLAYFGWPQAYEDQAERAVHAALEAVQAVSALATEAGNLAARTGIATGDVVVGDMAGESGAIAGETPNLAARLQGVADPHQVVISDNTRQLIGQVFDLTDLGIQHLKGFHEGVAAWHVLGAQKSVESRFEAAHGGALTDFVGRTHELGMLLERWHQVRDGDGQVVLVSGEAGIGKSRIVQAMQEQISGEEFSRLRFQCSPYYTNSAFYPFIQQLEHAAALNDDDAAGEKLEKLTNLFANQSEAVKGTVQLFAHLLGIPHEDQYGPLNLPPAEILQRTIRAFSDLLLDMSQNQPVLVFFEDIHWIDPTSLATLEMAAKEAAKSKIMIILTHRPEWKSTFGQQSHITPLQLNRLGRQQGAEIVRTIAGTFVSNDIIARIVDRADGIPLFVEEVTKSLVESGLDMSSADIPATLQASLLARIDRLGSEAKEIAQIGAVIGREFTYRLLSAISGWNDDALAPTLDRLVHSELLQASGTVPAATYIFKHALIRDAAYESMLREARQNWHAKAGQYLKQISGGDSGKQIEAIASHFENARQPVEAGEHWYIAGEQAVARAANLEAVHFSDRALSQLALIPDSQDVRQKRLAVLTQKLQPSLSVFGYSAPEVEELSAQSLALCRELGDNETLFRILYYPWVVRHGSSLSQATLDQAQIYFNYAEEAGSEAPLLIGHRLLGTGLVMTGSPLQAWPHLQSANNAYVAERHAELRFQVGTDPLVASMAYSVIAAWMLGRYDTARKLCHDMVAQAHHVGHMPSLIYADGHLNMIYLLLGFPAQYDLQLEQHAARLADTPNVLFKAYNDVFVAYMRLENGQSGLAELEDALEIFATDFHSKIFTTPLRTKLAERYLEQGDQGTAIALVTKAESNIAAGNELFWQSEVKRLRGDCHMAGDSPDFSAAANCYQTALDFTTARGITALRLRVAMSLAKMYRRQDSTLEAREVLGAVLAEITEGNDFPDVVNARNLLHEIG